MLMNKWYNQSIWFKKTQRTLNLISKSFIISKNKIINNLQLFTSSSIIYYFGLLTSSGWEFY
jgi:hypothetical protein